MGEQGIASWMFAVYDETHPWAQEKYAVSRFYTDFDFLIQYVRNPRTAIPSIIVENQYAPDSFDFRKRHIERAFGDDISLYQTELEKAIISFIKWNQTIQNQNPDLTVKVESCEAEVLRFCQQNNLVGGELSIDSVATPRKDVNSSEPYKGEVYEKPTITAQMWKEVRLDLKKELNEFCKTHGYPKLYDDNWEYLDGKELATEANNRLIFSINPGRSGSNYLAELLGTAEEVISHHEAEPTITGKYIQAINKNNYEQSFSERWIKVEEIKKSLDNLSPGQVYVDTSHVFIKTFFDVVTEGFKDNVEIIILRRNLVSVLKSFIELGYFSQKNLVWPDWMSSPNAKTAAIKCIGKDEELDQYDLCIAYLIDMEARALRFQKDYPWVKTYEVYLENLNDYDLVKKLFANLGITPTAKTREICAIPINQREAKKKEINAGQVSLEYCNQRIAMYIEKAKSMGIEIPKTLAWNAAPTSKKAENIIQGKIKIAHIINPVIVKESSDLYIAQPITFTTMKTARQQASGKVDVTLYTAQYPEDRAIIPESFIQTPDLDRSILDIANFQEPRKLPLIKDILDRLYEAAPDADYLIYTNADIALQPHFYTEVAKIIEQGYDAFVINRRTIPDKYKDISEIPLMYAEKGKPHPGQDCFVFKRSLYPKFYLETHAIGIGFCFRSMLLNCLCHAENFQEFKDLYLTFHIGNEETWKNDKWKDYLSHNTEEVKKVLNYYLNQRLIPNHPLIWERFSSFIEANPLPEAGFKAQITAPETLTTTAGEKLELAVKVKNISAETWQAAHISKIRLGNHWLDENSEKLQNDDGRTALLQKLEPTESIELPLAIQIPATPGNYLLELDMVQERVAWFQKKGSKTTRVKVKVNPVSENVEEAKLKVELPPDATAKDYYQLGESLQKQQQPGRALIAYQKAIELDANNSWYRHSLGNIFRKQNQYEKAIAAYQQAIELNPKFPWSHYYLGNMLEKQGQIQEAIKAYRVAVELYPNFKMYQNSLDKLTQLAKSKL
jgi:tetratricopeptide (TPR) repeat protein